jgi:glycosyltransferase involved in cell wall biosynthesis
VTGPLVSVVVPTRNREDILRRCLAALAVQTYAPFEIVVVDDASTDRTPEILAEFAATHPTIALIALRNQPQRGANPSRKRGIEHSRGTLIAFEDDDCIADPHWLAELVAGFASESVGAVTGLVEDPPARNVFDLAFHGTHRVYGEVHATRLIAGNMCVRRHLLDGTLDEDRAAVSADTSVSGRGDEEDLFLKLRADGHEIRVARGARVLHEHFYTRETFFRQAYKGGGSAARLGYKYHLPPRPELVCLAVGDAFLVGAFSSPWCLVASGIFFALFASATLVYNEIWRKGKTPVQALRVAPVMTAYYHVRAFGYFRQLARAWLGFDRIRRVRLDRGGAS